jgi:hypothetical protein
MNYERKTQLIKEFKESFHNKNLKPTYAELGHKIEGKLNFNIFVFYAILRNKNIEKTTHDIKSEKFLSILYILKDFENKNSRYKNDLYNNINIVFPSILIEEVEELIKNYFN